MSRPALKQEDYEAQALVISPVAERSFRNPLGTDQSQKAEKNVSIASTQSRALQSAISAAENYRKAGSSSRTHTTRCIVWQTTWDADHVRDCSELQLSHFQHGIFDGWKRPCELLAVSALSDREGGASPVMTTTNPIDLVQDVT